ncbi:MAG TPA: hypothetical protein VMU05_05750, partial [Dongiaceae bacterium]|nr:hypothetical protein [Dongiaceae bacterium]
LGPTDLLDLNGFHKDFGFYNGTMDSKLWGLQILGCCFQSVHLPENGHHETAISGLGFGIVVMQSGGGADRLPEFFR